MQTVNQVDPCCLYLGRCFAYLAMALGTYKIASTCAMTILMYDIAENRMRDVVVNSTVLNLDKDNDGNDDSSLGSVSDYLSLVTAFCAMFFLLVYFCTFQLRLWKPSSALGYVSSMCWWTSIICLMAVVSLLSHQSDKFRCGSDDCSVKYHIKNNHLYEVYQVLNACLVVSVLGMIVSGFYDVSDATNNNHPSWNTCLILSRCIWYAGYPILMWFCFVATCCSGSEYQASDIRLCDDNAATTNSPIATETLGSSDVGVQLPRTLNGGATGYSQMI